jgi:hypothetical protein
MQFTHLTEEMEQIYLLFYEPTWRDAIQNRVVAFFNGPFCHVEIVFPEKFGIAPWEKEVWGSSIYQGDTIFYKTKTYQREGYISFAIEVTKLQCLKIKNYCRMQAEKGVKFSKIAMYSAYLPFQVFKDMNGTFCSKHVTLALQEGGIRDIMHLNPCLVTPSSLYRVLLMNSAQSPIVQVVPSKMTNACNMSSTSNIICSKMANEMLDVFKNGPVAPPPQQTGNDMSQSFMKTYLLNPSQNKKLILFY